MCLPFQLQSSLLPQVNLAQQHLTQLGQSNASVASLVNGTLGINVAQQSRSLQNASSSVPLLVRFYFATLSSFTMNALFTASTVTSKASATATNK